MDALKQGARHALLIGVDQYDFLGELNYARQDAEALSKTLVDQCGFDPENVQVMSCDARGGLRAQGSYIEEMLASLTRRDQLDMLIFGFWGHGFSGRDGSLYLCGYDAKENQIERTGVSLSLIKAKLEQVGATETLYLLDCCQSRSAGRGAASIMLESTAKALEDAVHIANSSATPTGRSVAMLTSCKAGQTAYEWPERGHGVFTAHLLEGLSKGIGRASALADYVSSRVPLTTQSLYRNEQTPWFIAEGSGDISLIPDKEEPAPTEQEKRAVAAGAADKSSLMRFSADIREILFIHRRNNPCPMDRLLALYKARNPDADLDLAGLIDKMNEARELDLLSGFYFNSDLAFMSVEILTSKMDLNRSIKDRIGRHAAIRVCSGMTIGIDSGSTTLAVTRELVQMLHSNAINDLHVVTNSLPVANAFIDALVDLEQGDRRGLCEVTLVGGWCRPKSLATVPRSAETIEQLVDMELLPRKLDLSFVAANGFYEKRGFANSHQHEVPCKRYFSQAAKESIYLMESRKFSIEQDCLIEEFRDNLELITAGDFAETPEAQVVIDNLEKAGGKLTVCHG